MHWHVDAAHRGSEFYQRGDVATVRLARSRGMRALVLKHHSEPTAGLAYVVRLEVPDFDVFGGVVLNLTNGGINVAAVRFMATETKGAKPEVDRRRPAPTTPGGQAPMDSAGNLIGAPAGALKVGK